jgi:hypothetical protein
MVSTESNFDRERLSLFTFADESWKLLSGQLFSNLVTMIKLAKFSPQHETENTKKANEWRNFFVIASVDCESERK